MTRPQPTVPALLVAMVVAACALAACQGTVGTAGGPPTGPAPLPQDDSIFFFNVPTGDAQIMAHCMDVPDDRISKVFCATPKPSIHSLADLQTLLGLDFADRTAAGGNGTGGNPFFALSGNSSSVVARSVNAINPRAIVFKLIQDPGTTRPGFLIMTFTRGEQLAELTTYDIDDMGVGHLAMYLIKFEQPCSATHSCTTGDLLLPSLEKGWASATLYEDNELTNTSFDCLSCHQLPGAGIEGPRFLRMQERHAPFTHWFSSQTAGGRALLADFHAAHGTTEDYGPIPAALIDKSDPGALAGLVTQFGFGAQPNEFDSEAIEAEVTRSAPEQPLVNVPVGKSVTWQHLYDEAVAGRAIPPPYHDVKITDPDKLRVATDAYRQVVAGTLPPSWLPDIRDIVLDEALPQLTFAPAAGLSGHELLVQVCTQCHNADADPMATKARFDMTKLDAMPSAEKQLAVERLHLPDSDPHRMPPIRFRLLGDDEIARASAALQ